MDLVELDAASNNGVGSIREITAGAALGSPGKRKVYLLDEVHMLSPGASNALLKTLEEPPEHVIFVLATTDPQKVLPTIRSRTQHVELTLIPAELLSGYVNQIAERADLQVDAETIDYVVERGAGSVRDTLSALDQVVTAGGIPQQGASIDSLIEGIAHHDLERSMAAIAEIVASGVEAKDLTYRATRKLRDIFLAGAGVDPVDITAEELPQLAAIASEMTRVVNVRALELLGQALVDMRQAPDQRLVLDLALVRLFAVTPEPQADQKIIDSSDTTQKPGSGPAAQARAALASVQSSDEPDAPVVDSDQAPVPPPPPSNDIKVSDSQDDASPATQVPDKAASALSITQVTEIWKQQALPALTPRARARYQAAAIVTVSDGEVRFELPNETHRERCEQMKDDIEAALRNALGVQVQVELTVAKEEKSRTDNKPKVVAEEEVVDPAEFEVSADSGPSSVDRVLEAFPGAVASDDEGNGRS